MHALSDGNGVISELRYLVHGWAVLVVGGGVLVKLGLQLQLRGGVTLCVYLDRAHGTFLFLGFHLTLE